MNITQENTANLTATLKIQLAKEDYHDRVEKALREMQKKAQMPGFRTGKVPMGIVNKLYGKSVRADEIHKVLIDGVYEYIKEKELKILGNPLPDNNITHEIDWDNQTDFEFYFQIGLAPEIDFKLDNTTKVEYLKIKVENSMIEETLNDLRRRYGKLVNPETVENSDIVYGELVELDGDFSPIPDGLSNKSNLFVQFLKDEDIKSQFNGKTVGASLDIDISKSIQNETEMANILGVKADELKNYGTNYRFTIEKISRVEPAELNTDFFNKAAPDKNLTSEEEFRAFLKRQIELQYQSETDKYFRNEAIKAILDKTAIELPEEFLKRWILETNTEKQKFTPEQIETEFALSKNGFKWHLIENKLISDYKIEVTDHEVQEYLKNYMRTQLLNYGQDNPDNEMINSLVQRYLNNKEEVKRVYDKLYNHKLTDLFKQYFYLVEKEVTFKEFLEKIDSKTQHRL